ncbi:MAG: hypothetical protein ACJATT_002310 [Myxococcota bacterium]|jgi:hypothetical protein
MSKHHLPQAYQSEQIPSRVVPRHRQVREDVSDFVDVNAYREQPNVLRYNRRRAPDENNNSQSETNNQKWALTPTKALTSLRIGRRLRYQLGLNQALTEGGPWVLKLQLLRAKREVQPRASRWKARRISPPRPHPRPSPGYRPAKVSQRLHRGQHPEEGQEAG